MPEPTPIDHAEQFEHLSRAPIVEAVIEFRTRAEADWERSHVESTLRDTLADYPKHQSLTRGSLTAKIRLSEDAPDSDQGLSTVVERDWLGVRAESSDGLQIATFTRDGFSLSRLEPYQAWAQLYGEAIRLWKLHASLAKPSETQRIGVRYINRFRMPPKGRPSEYLSGLGAPGVDLPVEHFLHKDTLAVPGTPYAVNMVRAMQPSEGDTAASLILDIDAFCPEPTATELRSIEKALADLRWLKNRVFFSALTENALKDFR